MHIYIYKYVCAYIYIHIYVCIYIHMRVCIRKHPSAKKRLLSANEALSQSIQCTCMDLHHLCIRIFKYIHMYVCISIYICIYACIRTYPPKETAIRKRGTVAIDTMYIYGYILFLYTQIFVYTYICMHMYT